MPSLVANFYDCILDLIYCGSFLQKKTDRKGTTPGYTSSQSCRYIILQSIFKHMSLNTRANFLDVGCGQGRILAYLLRKSEWDLTGVDSNKLALQVCRKWSGKTRIKTIEQDVFRFDISNYDIFFLGHPFDYNHLLLFVEKMEMEVKKNTIVIVVHDMDTGDSISKRKGWSIIKQEQICRFCYLPLPPQKMRFSIYSYRPRMYDYN